MNLNKEAEKQISSVNSLILSKDPLHLRSYCCKYVSLKTTDGKEHEGWVKTIDPVSESIILVRFSLDGEPCELEVVLGHAVSSINVIPTSEDYSSQVEQLFVDAQDELPNETVSQRKECLKNWLVKNHIPVQEGDQGELTVAGCAVIHPPYRQEDCVCVNEIVLGKFQNLISTMPKENNQS